VRAADSAARALFTGSPDADDPNIPTREIPAPFVNRWSLAELFVASGLVSSRGEARRKAAEGALWMDGDRVTDVDVPFRTERDNVLLRFGKKRYLRIRLTP
jgi:tyrosyl-tRNA synthetase